MYYEKELQKAGQKLKNQYRKKVTNYMLSGKITLICLMAG